MCQIRWQTTIFNKLFSKIGRFNPKATLLWFTLGSVFAVVSMVISVVVLVAMLYRSLRDTKADQLLQPVVRIEFRFKLFELSILPFKDVIKFQTFFSQLEYPYAKLI